MLKTTAIAAAIILAATSQAGGCGGGNSNPAPAPAGPPQCTFDLQFTGPAAGQFTATLAVSCNVPVAAASTSLAIQQRPLGSGNMGWQNYDQPLPSAQVPPFTLTAKALCSPGEWEASASIDGTAVNGAPITAQSTSTPITVANTPACNY